MQQIGRTSRFRRPYRYGVIFALLLATVGLHPVTARATSSIPVASPCGRSSATSYSHVVWIVLENRGYSVIGSGDAPYLNSVARDCGLATQDYAVTHPSLPNYIALTSGSPQGITDDAEPSQHHLRVANIFSQLGSNWSALIQSMPSRCDRVTSGEYAARHNPAVYYSSLGNACQKHDAALTSSLNLSKKFTFIAPNVCNDMHSCSIATGDRWLRHFVPLVVASPQYQAGSLVLIITFDENEVQSSNRVPALVIAPSVPRGLKSSQRFSHYSILASTESLLNLPLLGDARTAPLMLRAFNL